MISVENAAYSEWYEHFNWKSESCHLNRSGYGNYLSAYIRNQKQGLVLNLNGSWGTGKTYFLKQLYTNLLKVHALPVVYIDAWKSDFSDDPLLVLISELLDQLQALLIDEQDEKKFQRKKTADKLLANMCELGKQGWNTSLDITAAFLSTKNQQWETGLDATALYGLANHLKFNSSKNTIEVNKPRLGSSLKENYKKQLLAIESTKELMTNYVSHFTQIGESSDSTKVYILIDELDRCRPSYAIELLEVVKHLFEIPNFVFVIATDAEQLSNSIKAVYGNDFDGKEYLSRFFNRTATIPQGDLRSFISAKLKNTQVLSSYMNHKAIFPSDSSAQPTEEFVINEFSNIISAYKLSLRRAEQIIAKFDSIVTSLDYSDPDSAELFDFKVLLQLLIEHSSSNLNRTFNDRKDLKPEPFNTHPEDAKELLWNIFNTDHTGHLVRQMTEFYNSFETTDDDIQKQRYLTKVSLDNSWKFFLKCKSDICQSTLSQEFFAMREGSHRSAHSTDLTRIHSGYCMRLDEIFRMFSKVNIWTCEKYFSHVELAGTLT
ncbi:KAP family P-loop NTPase fold protein [Pseudoalteromonas maricaloris]|nr:P-loop NTPase fold protein [Pseudoalteromonas maricaloris]WOX30741.1 P-loop NTPase fold protein [Pseudoalteromonas maricaloris]